MALPEDDVLAAALDQQCAILASALSSIETKCSVMQGHMVASEESSVDAQIRWGHVGSMQAAPGVHAAMHHKVACPRLQLHAGCQKHNSMHH